MEQAEARRPRKERVQVEMVQKACSALLAHKTAKLFCHIAQRAKARGYGFFNAVNGAEHEAFLTMGETGLVKIDDSD